MQVSKSKTMGIMGCVHAWFVVYDEITTPSVGLLCAIGVTTAVHSDITCIDLVCMPCALE